ncbi:MAG: ATP-binding protein [Puniceicoccales bacterium]|jgi:predicted AAA+ superfamily ATPase|nr:ATP-binding protein [Puniceicoccales bacterium]
MAEFLRWQMAAIERALAVRRIVIIGGARQVGKTTLARSIARGGKYSSIYYTLDDGETLAAAKSDCNAFLANGGKLTIIDEIQRLPQLLPAIKMAVDRSNEKGQFLLTGSANIQTLPTVTESLAGRVRHIRLCPLTQGEVFGRPPTFLDRMFGHKFSNADGELHRKDLITLAFRGGYPEVLELSESDRKRWHGDYLHALLDRDLGDIVHIRRRGAMDKLVTILASWSSKFFSSATIASGVGINRQTLDSYANALEMLFIVDRLPPWTDTDYKRIGRSDKFFFADTGLMASLLNWNCDQVAMDSDRFGKLVETFVFNELKAQVFASDGKFRIFHYRDRDGREVDFIVEREDGSMLGIEVKGGSNVGKDDFKHLRWFSEKMAKDRSFTGIVISNGKLSYSMGENMQAVPIQTLWA